MNQVRDGATPPIRTTFYHSDPPDWIAEAERPVVPEAGRPPCNGACQELHVVWIVTSIRRLGKGFHDAALTNDKIENRTSIDRRALLPQRFPTRRYSVSISRLARRYRTSVRWYRGRSSSATADGADCATNSSDVTAAGWSPTKRCPDHEAHFPGTEELGTDEMRERCGHRVWLRHAEWPIQTAGHLGAWRREVREVLYSPRIMDSPRWTPEFEAEPSSCRHHSSVVSSSGRSRR